MRIFLLSFLLLMVIQPLAHAQEVEKDTTSLLTSRIWQEGNEQEVAILYKFNTDGTFFSTAIMNPTWVKMFGGTIEGIGKWEWLSHDSFTIQTTQNIINGQPKDLNPEPYHKAVYRIQQIDLQTVKGIRYNILEKENSEYVTQFKWVVKE